MLKLALLSLLAASSPTTEAGIVEQIQPALDTFVFCVLDESVAKLATEEKAEAIANAAASVCEPKLDALETELTAIYQDVNKDVWPAGLASDTARENRDEYRALAVKAAIKVLEERRASR